MSLDLLTRRTTDVDAYRARIEAKRAIAHRHQAIERAAVVAATRPVKQPRARKVRQPRPNVERTSKGVELRPCVKCGHPTRSTRVPAERAPGSLQRRSGGMCSRCVDRNRPNKSGKKRAPNVMPAEVATWVAAYKAGQAITSIARDAGRAVITVRFYLRDEGAMP